MPTQELLLEEFDAEIKKTQAMLERVPMLAEYAPHERSMKLGKMAAHTAQLGGFGVPILTQPMLDFATANMKPATFESPEQLVALLNSGAAATRAAIVALPESAWADPWKLCFNDQVFFSGSRYAAYRAMFLNHLIHHRAQLGVYLRLNNIPIPGTYGPSADDHR